MVRDLYILYIYIYIYIYILYIFYIFLPLSHGPLAGLVAMLNRHAGGDQFLAQHRRRQRVGRLVGGGHEIWREIWREVWRERWREVSRERWRVRLRYRWPKSAQGDWARDETGGGDLVGGVDVVAVGVDERAGAVAGEAAELELAQVVRVQAVEPIKRHTYLYFLFITHTRTHARTHARKYMYAQIYIYINININIYIHVHIYVYICIHSSLFTHRAHLDLMSF